MRVRRICKEYGVVEPVFQEIFNGFMVTLFKELLNEGSVLDEKDVTKESTIEVVSVTSGHNDKTSDLKLGERLGNKLGNKLGERLSEINKSIIELIQLNSAITIVSLAKNIGVSQTAIENNLSKLKKYGLITRVGPAKGGYWQINDQNKAKEKTDS